MFGQECFNNNKQSQIIFLRLFQMFNSLFAFGYNFENNN